MENSISIEFGKPEHGWLPVDFLYKDLHLVFPASDALNDPTEELYDAITQLQDHEVKRTIWWLEPGVYFFDYERKGQRITLTVIETNDLHDEHAENKTLLKITGDEIEIMEPFRVALRKFASQTYEEYHWPYHLDQTKLKDL